MSNVLCIYKNGIVLTNVCDRQLMLSEYSGQGG